MAEKHSDDEITSCRLKWGTKKLLDEERCLVEGGRRAETDDEVIQRMIKDLKEYRRRCG